jgi:hypothetical protein
LFARLVRAASARRRSPRPRLACPRAETEDRRSLSLGRTLASSRSDPSRNRTRRAPRAAGRGRGAARPGARSRIVSSTRCARSGSPHAEAARGRGSGSECPLTDGELRYLTRGPRGPRRVNAHAVPPPLREPREHGPGVWGRWRLHRGTAASEDLTRDRRGREISAWASSW